MGYTIELHGCYPDCERRWPTHKGPSTGCDGCEFAGFWVLIFTVRHLVYWIATRTMHFRSQGTVKL